MTQVPLIDELLDAICSIDICAELKKLKESDYDLYCKIKPQIEAIRIHSVS